MKSLKFVFMILILLSIANAAMAQEYLFKIDKENKVWITPPGASTLFVGTLETIPKGTRLYHWGKATPEQAKAWNDAGRISPEILDRLKQGGGFAGGGFYVSKDPTDSITYGNTQVVVELPKDIQVIKSAPNIHWQVKLWPHLEKAGISGVIVPHTHNWLNIIDAEALTSEFVATSDYYRKNPLKQIISPKQITEFFVRFPDLKTEPYYQDLTSQIEKLYSNISSDGKKTAAAAFIKIFEKGTNSAKAAALSVLTTQLKFNAFSDQRAVDLVLETANGTTSLAQTAALALSLYVKNPGPLNHHIFAKSARNIELLNLIHPFMKAQVTPEQFILILQEAEYYLKENAPFYVRVEIKRLREMGAWNPPPMCQMVFR